MIHLHTCVPKKNIYIIKTRQKKPSSRHASIIIKLSLYISNRQIDKYTIFHTNMCYIMTITK